MNNGIILLLFVIAVVLIKFIILTIRIHQHNLKIHQKLGNDVYEWLINDGEKFPPPIKLESDDWKLAMNVATEKIKILGETFSDMTTGIATTTTQFIEFTKAYNKFKEST